MAILGVLPPGHPFRYLCEWAGYVVLVSGVKDVVFFFLRLYVTKQDKKDDKAARATYIRPEDDEAAPLDSFAPPMALAVMPPSAAEGTEMVARPGGEKAIRRHKKGTTAGGGERELQPLSVAPSVIDMGTSVSSIWPQAYPHEDQENGPMFVQKTQANTLPSDECPELEKILIDVNEERFEKLMRSIDVIEREQEDLLFRVSVPLDVICNCVKGHQMVNFSSSPPEYKGCASRCDGCSAVIQPVNGFLHCILCSYDLCNACAHKKGTTAGGGERELQPRYCVKGHQMVKYLSYDDL